MDINYCALTDDIISRLTGKKTLMLHACCAPCSTAVLEYLKPHFDITLFYFNPNTQPKEEFLRRGEELKRLAKLTNTVVLMPEYDAESFFAAAQGLENEPEGGARCAKCFELRLLRTARAAKEAGADYFCTTLTVSPHKNARLINEIGKEIGEREGVLFLPSDFKKKDGYKRSIELSAQYGLYRQDYCGCEFARRNRGNEKMCETMFGVLKSRPEKGFELRNDLPMPSVGARDILVHVRAAAICGTDRHIYEWTDYAQKRVPLPMVFGHEFAGDVVKVGSEVTEVKPGDRVAGETHIPCNNCEMCRTDNRHICENMKIIGVHVPGAFAEYISFPADCAYKFDEGLTYENASMLEPMGVAMHGIDRAEVKNKNVLIYGCGPIGLMAVGAAVCMGARRVYAADKQEKKLLRAREMGAYKTINTKERGARDAIAEENDGVDVVIDYTGSIKAIRDGINTVKKGGRLVLVGLPSESMTIDLTADIIYKELTVIGVTGRLMYKTWKQCDELLKNEKFDISTAVGGVFPMREIGQAFAEIEAGTPGKMILIP